MKKIDVNFELLMLLGLVSFCLVIIFAPDPESKQMYGQVIDSLSKGFLGYVTRALLENKKDNNDNNNNSNNNQDLEKLTAKLKELEDKLNNNE